MVLSPTCVKKKKERKKTYPPPFRGNLDWPVVVCWCVELVSAARGGRRENACPVLFSGVCAAEQCTPRLPRFGEKPPPVTREGREPPSRGRRLACTSLSATLRVASPEAFPAQHRQGAGAEAEPWQKAGDKHYHPSCARCSRCNQMFTEGEEMYLQGSTVWHPDCKQSTKTEEKLRPTRTSSESIYSRPGSSIPGSPGHTIYAKVDNEILDYKDLAAIPKVKAIYDIERPDLITYEPFYSSGYDDKQERQSLGESPRTLSPTPSAEGYQDSRDRVIHRSTSQGSINSPVYSRHSYTPTTSRSPQHFHRPDQGINIYRKPPIYKQHAALAAQSKSSEDIIKFSKFPAAQAPDPSEIPKIETDHWPGPPSLAGVGADMRRRSSGREEDEEELLRRRQLQEEQLMKLNSGLGQLILKEEMEKESRERSLTASRYDSPINSASRVLSSKTSSLPGYGKNGLHRPVSTDFAQYNSYGDVSGGVRGKARVPGLLTDWLSLR
uniref:Actin binding LIM protein 1 n=1 Tax=Ursus maritimus TaxID=29073 RepID=A0A452T4D4_URSMA